MKILLTGSNGQLGRELTKQYTEIGNVELVLTDVDNMDITDIDIVLKRIREEKPDVIINCGALTAVDLCEEKVDLAYKVNAIGARNLAIAANEVCAEIVQVSTDYVFEGEEEKLLTEFEVTNPQTVYGASKLQGENFVREFNPKHYIVRTAWLYGDGNNFVKTMISIGEKNSELKVVKDQIGSPTSTVDLTKVIIELIKNKNYGVFHATCRGQCSWQEFAVEIFRLKAMDVKVIPCTTEEFPRPAKRPHFSVLRNYMLELTTGDITRDWKEALKDYIKGLK